MTVNTKLIHIPDRYLNKITVNKKIYESANSKKTIMPEGYLRRLYKFGSINVNLVFKGNVFKTRFSSTNYRFIKINHGCL